MNPFSAISWFWKGLRGHSITFAALFASGLIGLSLMRGLVHLLGELGVPWLGLIVLPMVIVGVLAKREKQWIPDETRRRVWARSLLFGSIALAILMAAITRQIDRWRHPEKQTVPSQTAPARPHGPSGK